MQAYRLPQTRAYNKALRRLLPGASHSNFRDRSRTEPIRFREGRGARLIDIDGNDYVDLNCQYGALLLGHGDRRLADALHAQIDRLIATTSADLELEAADKIRACFPGMEMMRFAVSGTDAALNAIRLARAFTGRRRVLRFAGHYHGSADAIMGGRAGHGDDAEPEPFAGDFYDTDGRDFAVVRQASFLLPWNDPDRLERVMRRHGDEVAAVLMEPYCINGGGFAPDPAFLDRARTLCDHHGTLLVFDEIITGLRMGLGGAQGALGLRPDLTLIGKALGGGVPIAVFGGRADVMRLLEQRKVVHGGTFNGHPMALAAASRTIDVLRDTPDYAVTMGEWKRRIEALFLDAAARHGFPVHFRGPPTIGVFHFGAPRADFGAYQTMDQAMKTAILANALASFGILVCPASRLYLTLAFGEADFARLAERLDPAFAQARRSLDLLSGERRAAE